MNKIVLSVCAVMAMSSVVYAGGDFKDVEPAMEPVVAMVEEDNGNFYAGIGLVYNRIYSAESSWFNDTPDTQDQTGGFTGILGYDFNDYIAAEGRISKTFFTLDYADMMAYSIFVKPQYPVTADFNVYGLFGFGLVQVDGENGGNPAANIGSTILDDTSFQWGLGANYALTESFSIFVDYTSLADDIDIDPTRLSSTDLGVYDKLSIDGITIGITYNF